MESRSGYPSAINIGTRLALTLAVLDLQLAACAGKQGVESVPSPTKPVPAEFTPTPDFSQMIPLSTETFFQNSLGTVKSVEKFSGDPKAADIISSQAEKTGIVVDTNNIIIMDLRTEKGIGQTAVVISPGPDRNMEQTSDNEFYFALKDEGSGWIDFVRPEDWTGDVKLRFIKLEFPGEGLISIPDGKGGYTAVFSVDVEKNKADFVFNTGGVQISLTPEATAKVRAALVQPATPTPEAPEQVFVPEGFQMGELGLLRNPETGKNVLVMNPEADWEAFRQMAIGSIWQASKDWAGLTGEQSDASKMTQEEFLSKALAGEKLTFGIPVRADTKGLEDKEPTYPESWGPYDLYTKDVKFKIVKARLDDVIIQVLDPVSFEKYMGGLDWYDAKQEAFTPVPDVPSASSQTAIHFAEKNGQLVISVGSYYFGDVPVSPRLVTFGKFDNEISKKYKGYYRPDGIGIEANKVATRLIIWTLEKLKYLPYWNQVKAPAYKRFTLQNFVRLSHIGNDKIDFFGDISPLFVFSQ